MISKIVSYGVLFLGFFCVVLFFDSLYSTFYHVRQRGLLGVVVLSLVMTAVLLLLEQFGILSFNLKIACW